MPTIIREEQDDGAIESPNSSSLPRTAHAVVGTLDHGCISSVLMPLGRFLASYFFSSGLA